MVRVRHRSTQELKYPSISARDKRLVLVEGEMVSILIPGRPPVEVFQAPGPVVAVNWPFPWRHSRD